MEEYLTAKLTKYKSVEHDDVQVVAVNDPFIEPKYAVRTQGNVKRARRY